LDNEKEELGTLIGTNGHNWEFGDQLFITQLLSELSEKTIQASITIFQHLAEEA